MATQEQDEDYMPAGMEVRTAAGDIAIVLTLTEPNVLFASRKIKLLLAERLDVYCRYPDFGGLIHVSLNPEFVEPNATNRQAFEILLRRHADALRDSKRLTQSGKAVRLQGSFGQEGFPRGELVRLGVREEFVTDHAAGDPSDVLSEEQLAAAESERAERQRVQEAEQAELAERRRIQAAEERARKEAAWQRRERALLPSGLLALLAIGVDFWLGLRSRGFELTDPQSFRLIVAVAAVVGLRFTKTSALARAALLTILFVQALAVGFGVFRYLPDAPDSPLASIQLRTLMFVVVGVLLLAARDRNGSDRPPQQRRMATLLGILGALVLVAVTPRPKVAACYAGPYGPHGCNDLLDATACESVPGCRVSAACVAHPRMESDSIRCGEFTTRESCQQKRVFCGWNACDGVPGKACSDFTPFECPARLCRRVDY